MQNNTNKKSFFIAIFPLLSLYLAMGFLAVGYGMLMTYIGVYLKNSGSSDIAIGLINSAFFIGAILSSLLSQKIISTIGHIRSFSTFAAIMVITFLFHSMYVDEIFWAVLRLISGFAYYGILIILESWISEKSVDENRGQILAMYSITFYSSTAIGQMILNIGENLQQTIFIIGSILVLGSLIVIAITKIKEPILIPFERYSFPKLASVAPLALLGSFIAGFMVSGFFTMAPLFALETFQAMNNLVIFIMLTLFGGLIAQYPVGRFSDRFGRRKFIAYGGIFIAFISFLFVINSGNTTFHFLLGVLLRMGIFCIYPLSVARANDVNKDSKNVVEISRSLLFVYAIGSFSAPMLIGFGNSMIGFKSMFVFYIILGIILCIFALSRDRVPDEQLTVFVNAAPLSTEVLPQIDPRQDEQWVDEQKEQIQKV
jgi:MFS family permease